MKYLCLVYLEESKLDAVPDSECKACGEALRKNEQHIAAEALQSIHTATTVRVRNGSTKTASGPATTSAEQIIGFYVVEAKNQDEAIAYAAKVPSAAVGSIEVRPIIGS